MKTPVSSLIVALIARAQEAIAAKDWTRAAAVMRKALAGHPGNADYHNLYAYALRKGPNPDMKEVFREYEEALRIDPGHRNAHEYIGEAYSLLNRSCCRRWRFATAA